jgi:hypothetical protein
VVGSRQRDYLHVLEDRAAATLVLHLQKTLGTLALLLRQLAEEVAHASQSHIVTIEIVALREESGNNGWREDRLGEGTPPSDYWDRQRKPARAQRWRCAVMETLGWGGRVGSPHQREVGVGGPQMQIDQAVDTSLHLGGIILTNLRGHGWSSVRR